MGIFAALVGIALYGAHSIRHTNAEERFQHQQKVNNMMGMSLQARFEVEKSITDIIEKEGNTKIFYEKFGDRLEKYFKTSDYKQKLCTGDPDCSWTKLGNKWAANIMLAEKGYVRAYNYIIGYPYNNPREREIMDVCLHVMEDLLHEAGRKDAYFVIQPQKSITSDYWFCNKNSHSSKVVFLHQVDPRMQNLAMKTGRLWKD